MAAFNPIPDPVQPENAMDFSRGISNSRVFQTLFGGAADAIHGYVNARDEHIKTQIYEDTLATTDKLQQPYIDALNADGGATIDGSPMSAIASDPSSGNNQNVQQAAAPAALTAAAGNIARLQQAKNAGTARDTYYHNQLNSMVKSLRANFPGYNEQIDSIVQGITGITPANSLVADYFQEAAKNAAKTATAADKWQTFIDTHNDSLARAGLQDVLEHPDVYSTPEAQGKVRASVAQVEAADANVASANASLALKAATNSANSTDYYQTYKNQAGVEAGTSMSALANLGSGAVEKLKQAQANPSAMSPDDLAGINSGLSQALMAQTEKSRSFLYDPYDDTGRTRAGDMHNPAWEDDIRKTFLSPIIAMQDAVNNKDYGLAVFNANLSKAILDQTKATTLQKVPSLANLSVNRELGGDSFVNSMMAELSPGSDTWKETMRQTAALAAGAGNSSLDETTQMFKTDNNTKGDPNLIKQGVDDIVKLFLDPKTPPQILANYAEHMYGARNSGFLSNNFQPEQRTYMYSKLVNDQIANRIAAIGDPNITGNYIYWAGKQFSSLFKADMNEVQKGVVNRKYLEVGWNQESSQITMQPTAGNPITRQFQQSGGDHLGAFLNLTPYDAFEGIMSNQAIDAKNRLNLQITALKSAVKLAGLDPNVEILKLMEANGFNPDAPKQGNFFDQVGSAIAGAAESVDNYMRNK